MSEAIPRIEFDATLDEMVDVGLRLWSRSKTSRAARSRALWFVGGATSLVFLIVIRTDTASLEFPAAVWILWVVLALALGVGFAYIHRAYMDWSARRRTKQFVAEHLGGATQVHCEIELQPKGVKVLQNGLEMVFPWSGAIGIEDNVDDVELQFTSGLVVARNRAFLDAAERVRFIERARTLAGRKDGSA